MWRNHLSPFSPPLKQPNLNFATGRGHRCNMNTNTIINLMCKDNNLYSNTLSQDNNISVLELKNMSEYFE